MFALLLPLLAQLPGLFGEYFKQKNAIVSAKLELERQVEMAKQQLAGEIAKAQMELNQTIVNATSSYFKYFTFMMWFGPFMIGTVFPLYSKEIFINLATMPEWYVQSCLAIMFTVWGISVSAPAVSSIFSSLGTFFANRREYKIEKAKTDRKAFYEALRQLKGVVTPDDVLKGEAMFNKMDEESK